MNACRRTFLFLSKNLIIPPRYRFCTGLCNRRILCQSCSSQIPFTVCHLHTCIGRDLSSGVKLYFVSTAAAPQLSTNVNSKLTFDDVFSDANFERVKKDISKIPSLRSAAVLQVKEKPPEAAVLIPLCYVDGKPSILFTVRTTSLTNHRGEVSFPGGRMDTDDTDVVHSALREMEEEIGIAMDTVKVLGAMKPLPSLLNLFVTPVLGFCGEIDLNKLKLSTDEVEEVFSRTIESLCDPANFRTTQYRIAAGYTLPVYLGEKHRIWGFTAVILHQTLALLAPTLYKAKVKHRRRS